MAEELDIEQIKSPGSLLADSLYDTPVETPADPPPDPEIAAEPLAEAPDPEVLDPEAPEVLDPEASEAEGVELSSIEELAEHFELDKEWLEGLSTTQKINGKEVSVSIAEALTTHRQVAAGDEYLSDAKAKAKLILEDSNQQKESLAGTIATFGNLLKSVEAEIEKDTKGIDWADLREKDPAEYSAKREEIRERRERLDTMKKDATDAYRSSAQQLQQQQQSALLENLPNEEKVLLERVPEWSDEDARLKERDELAKYLFKEGFGAEDIKMASFNGRLIALSVKAMRYDKSKLKSQAARKKVVKVPKILKPGVPKDKPKPNGKDDPVSILYG